MKKSLLILLSLVIILSTCIMPVYAAPPAGGKIVPVTGVSLNVVTLSLKVGSNQTLTAIISPKNATNKEVIWSSSSDSIATVSASGVVTAKAAGNANIIVTTTDGRHTATCAVTVTDSTSTPIPVTGVTLDKTTLALVIGGKEQLTATISPLEASDKTVNWSSDNETVASVDPNGLVTAKAAGFATITVTTTDGRHTATCAVTVTDSPPITIPVEGVTLNKIVLTLESGKSETLVATISPSDATNKAVAWSSSDSYVATVDSDGLVTGMKAGTSTIIATTSDGSFTATCAVTVTAPTTIPVAGVTLNKTALTLESGNKETLVATISPLDATNKAVAWSSSDSSVATVDSNGLVTAVKAGTATITITTTDGSFTATCAVTVTAPTPTNIHYVALGDSIATGTTSRGTTTSYVSGFYAYLKTQYPNNTLSVANLAYDGDASDDLLYKLTNNTPFQDEVKKANIITISIGGNNILSAGKNYFSIIDHVIAQAGTLAFEDEYAKIIARIRLLNPNVKIISSTLYNPYNSTSITGYTGDPKLHGEVKPYIDRINAKIKGIVNDNNYVVADVYSRFLPYANGGKMGSITYFYPSSWLKFTRDPHPNQTGQNLINEVHKGVFIP